MKKLTLVALIAGLTAVAAFTTTAFKPERPIVRVSEDCSQWQKMSSHYIQMKWCVDEFGEVNHQFFNGYSFQVHFWYKFDCTDGKNYTGNTYVDAGAQSERADMMKSKPSMWYITRKERKDDNGQWVAF